MSKFLKLSTAFLIAVGLTFGLELLFALIVKTFGLTSNVIRPINQVIKAVSILAAVFIGVDEKGLTFGALLGLFYGIVLGVVFGLIGGNLAFDLWFFIDLLFCLLVGGIGGVLGVNLKNK